MNMNKHGRKVLIFIVDDDKFLLDMYAVKFGEKGLSVETAVSGGDALDKIKSGYRPDIILLDIVMPGISGFEVLEKIKKNKLAGSPVIIVLSNLGQKEDIDKGLRLGADGYIVKASSTPSEVVTKALEIYGKKKD